MPELHARDVIVELRQPGRGAPAVRALGGIDLAIERGELVAVMGGSGAGKSTLALALAGLVPLTRGSVDGAAVGAVRVVLQRPESTFLQEQVLDEVALGARASGVSSAQALLAAREALAELALPADIEPRDPLALSGGEQRRVAIAATLTTNPRVLVLDEPGAGLDAAARHELHRALARLHAAGRTIVLVTHDPGEAAQLATRLVVLRHGVVVSDGDPRDVLADPDRAAALGIDVAPEVAVLRAVGAGLGIEAARVADPRGAMDELERIMRVPRAVGASGVTRGPTAAGELAAAAVAVTASHGGSFDPARGAPLPPLVDARLRLLACALVVTAALTSDTVAATAAVVLACVLVIATARISRARVRLAVRPLIALTIMLVALQMLLGGDATTLLYRDRSSDAPALAAILRSLQAAGVVLATLALSGATATTDLAAALRRVLSPLRWIRLPVDAAAFVVATGLGLVPAFADELERLRLAQRARGIRPIDAGVVAGLRADTQLLTPLFVAAFRRAHLLADALVVRGIDPRRSTRSWRPRTVPRADLLLVVGGIGLLAMARFA